MGIVKGGLNCQQNIPLKNQDPDHPLTDVTIALDTSIFNGSFFGGCGIDDSEGDTSCAENQLIDFGPMDMFQHNITYNLDTMDVGDSDTIWEYALMSMAIFNHENLYGSYIKDGKRYRGKIHACTNRSNNHYRPFTLRHREVIHGNMLTIGNTILVAPQDQSSNVCNSYRNGAYRDDTNSANNYYELCAYYDDPNANFPTTTAQLPLPSGDDVEVVWAGLYWQALVEDSYDIEDMTIKIKHQDSSQYETVDFDQLDWMKDVGHSGYISYSAFKDVTYLFQNNNWKSGDITVGDIPVAEGKIDTLGTYGAWTLVVIYKKDNEKFRAMNVYDGWQQVDSDHAEVDIPISDFITPKSTPVSAQTSVFTAEGDKYIPNDYLKAKPSKQTNWTMLTHASDNQTFYSAINTPVSFTRSPDPTNNQGIDIQAFNLGTDGLNIIKPAESSIDFKFGSDQDRYWPSMISFSAELRTPNLCYDYSYKQNGRYFTEENDGSKDPHIKGELFSEDPVKVGLFIKNQEESDLVLKNIKMKIDDINTTQATYINDSVRYIPPGHYQKEVPSDITSSDSFVHASVGGLGAKEFFYFYYDLDPKTYTMDMPINGSLEYDMVITIPDTNISKTFHYPKQEINAEIPLCVDGNFSYAPIYGNFNVEEYASTYPNIFYNINTQVARRVDDFKVKAYGDANSNGAFDTPVNVSTIVALELIDASAYEETQTSCQEPGNAITPRIWLTFDNNVSSIDFTNSVINDAIQNNQVSDQILNQPQTMGEAEDFYRVATQNTAFRVTFLTSGNGTLLNLTPGTCQGNQTPPCFKVNNFPDLTQLDVGAGPGNCGQDIDGNPNSQDKIPQYCGNAGERGLDKKHLAQCMECIYGYNLNFNCSRDNFAIRPKAFKISLADDNTSAVVVDFSNNTDKSGSASTPINLVAGYPYRIDINATSFTDEFPVKGYTRIFNSSDQRKRAYMQWDPRTISVAQANTYCNTPSDNNMSFRIIDGTNTNPNPLNKWIDRHDALDNVGEYIFKVIDKKWTKYDWDENLTQHHYNNHFISDSKDCIEDSNEINPIGNKVGCDTSSVYANEYKKMYIRAYPYTFDVTSLSYGARPSNDSNNNTWVYMNTLDQTQYPNGVDDNMSYNIQGTFTAAGYDNAPLSNYVDQCYAESVDMHLVANFLSNQTEAPQMKYDLFDYNNTNYTNHNTSDISYSTTQYAAITQPNSNFVKELNGSINMDLGYNFVHPYNIPSNPVYLEIKDFNISKSVQPSTLFVKGVNDYKIYGNMDIDKNVTFIYGRAKPSKYFYDDVTANSVTTPISIVAYCDKGPIDCSIDYNVTSTGLTYEYNQTNEYSWYLVSRHNKANNDGKVVLTASANGTVNPTDINPVEGIDTSVTVTYTGGNRPDTVNIDFVTTNPTDTSRWLIYNKSSNTIPSPFYRAHFINTGDWAGYGKTGNVMETNASVTKNRRLGW